MGELGQLYPLRTLLIRLGRAYDHRHAVRGARGGLSSGLAQQFFPLGECYVRIERKGSTIFGSSSTDGKTWKNLKPIDTVWPKKIKVGLHAVTSSNQPFTAEFKEFSLVTK